VVRAGDVTLFVRSALLDQALDQLAGCCYT